MFEWHFDDNRKWSCSKDGVYKGYILVKVLPDASLRFFPVKKKLDHYIHYPEVLSLREGVIIIEGD